MTTNIRAPYQESHNSNGHTREKLLEKWAAFLVHAARQGALTGSACSISSVDAICGPRAGALELRAGLDSGSLLQVLGRNSNAVLRQFIPWRFAGDPQCYMSGRYVRVEAGWPNELAETMIRLDHVSDKPDNSNAWVAGVSETGDTVVPHLDDRTPHFLVSGATGSGKSVALRCGVLQFSACAENQIVLLDGKYGESLRDMQYLPGIVGPCAVDGPQIRNALGWAASEMQRRYQSGRWRTRLIVVFDEFQELVEDQVIVSLLRKLTTQGRAAHVHCILATQHPTVQAFGDPAVRRNLTGKIALLVNDADASRVAVGGPLPRADHLLGAGDAYAVAPGSCHRAQMVYVDRRDIERADVGTWQFPQWPDYDPESVGQGEAVNWAYSGEELAVAIVSAAEGEGRPKMMRRMEEANLGRPGAERAIRLLQLGRDAHSWLLGHNYAVCLSGNGGTQVKNASLVIVE